MATQKFLEEMRSTYGNLIDDAKAGRLPKMVERRKSVTASLNERSDGGMTLSKATAAADLGTDIVPQYRIQGAIRPVYGKIGINPSSIGDHPDFEHLRHTENLEYSPITTMFMDMVGSTQLEVIYPPHVVVRIKNVFILAATEIVKAFDGHVHRIMGDAVMAYFGQRDGKAEQGIIDALNCASTLMLFVKNVVIPKLREETPDTEFGIRIGLDHGVKDEVVWSCFGYPDMCEVTATSFHVSVASKLQQAAGKNQIMIGEGLREQFDLHEELAKVKKVTRNGIEVDDGIVTPNYKGKNGRAINYRQWLFDADRYFTLSPLVSQSPEFLLGAADQPSVAPLEIRAKMLDDGLGSELVSCGSVVPKDRWIEFRVVPPDNGRYPCTVQFKVENHGNEARTHGGESYDNHVSDVHEVVNAAQLVHVLRHGEGTCYRGLHYLIVEMRSGGVLTHRGRFGVYIE